MSNVQYDKTLAQLNMQCFEIAVTLFRDKEIMFKVVQSLTWSNCSYIRGRTIMRASTLPWDQRKPLRLPQTHSVAARALWAPLFSIFSSFKFLVFTPICQDTQQKSESQKLTSDLWRKLRPAASQISAMESSLVWGLDSDLKLTKLFASQNFVFEFFLMHLTWAVSHRGGQRTQL